MHHNAVELLRKDIPNKGHLNKTTHLNSCYTCILTNKEHLPIEDKTPPVQTSLYSEVPLYLFVCTQQLLINYLVMLYREDWSAILCGWLIYCAPFL